MENFNRQEHAYVNWSDEELGQKALEIVGLLKESKWYSDTRRKQQIARLACINFEQEQRYLDANPDVVNLSSLDNLE